MLCPQTWQLSCKLCHRNQLHASYFHHLLWICNSILLTLSFPSHKVVSSEMLPFTSVIKMWDKNNSCNSFNFHRRAIAFDDNSHFHLSYCVIPLDFNSNAHCCLTFVLQQLLKVSMRQSSTAPDTKNKWKKFQVLCQCYAVFR